MTSEVSVLFLNRLLLAYPDVPILLLWDRATWHKGAEVRAVLATNPRLEVLWFPPGCPELNPQEHVWKAVREAVSHNHRHERLTSLADAFERHLNTKRHLNTTRFPCSLLAKYDYENVCAMFK
jgi:transposase